MWPSIALSSTSVAEWNARAIQNVLTASAQTGISFGLCFSNSENMVTLRKHVYCIVEPLICHNNKRPISFPAFIFSCRLSLIRSTQPAPLLVSALRTVILPRRTLQRHVCSVTNNMATASLARAASGSGMHRALTHLDILNLILDETSKIFPQELCLSTLQAVARTCRTFLEPALDCVWYEQVGLGHLVQCFPEGLWLTEGEDNEVLVRLSCL